MSAAKFTPGPWKVITEQTAREVEVFEIADVAHFRVIPDRPNTWETQGDAFADASLLAVAPELLDMLRQCRDYLSCIPESAAGGDDDAVILTRNADKLIAKATGSTT